MQQLLLHNTIIDRKQFKALLNISPSDNWSNCSLNCDLQPFCDWVLKSEDVVTAIAVAEVGKLDHSNLPSHRLAHGSSLGRNNRHTNLWLNNAIEEPGHAAAQEQVSIQKLDDSYLCRAVRLCYLDFHHEMNHAHFHGLWMAKLDYSHLYHHVIYLLDFLFHGMTILTQAPYTPFLT